MFQGVEHNVQDMCDVIVKQRGLEYFTHGKRTVASSKNYARG